MRKTDEKSAMNVDAVELARSRYLNDVVGFRFWQDRRGTYMAKHPHWSSYSYKIVIIDDFTLMITGDMGTYVFERGDIASMFVGDPKKEPHINPEYWSQKLVAQDRYSPMMEFSHQKFIDVMVDEFRRWEFRPGANRMAVWKRFRADVLEADVRSYEMAVQVIEDFDVADATGNRWYLTDIGELNFNEYGFHYLWCLWAIVYTLKSL